MLNGVITNISLCYLGLSFNREIFIKQPLDLPFLTGFFGSNNVIKLLESCKYSVDVICFIIYSDFL